MINIAGTMFTPCKPIASNFALNAVMRIDKKTKYTGANK